MNTTKSFGISDFTTGKLYKKLINKKYILPVLSFTAIGGICRYCYYRNCNKKVYYSMSCVNNKYGDLIYT
jgi:hypothetical protein